MAVVESDRERLTEGMRAGALSEPRERTPQDAAAGACEWTYEEDES